MLHQGSQEALEGSLEGPQKIHTKDYYIFYRSTQICIPSNLFWLFSFDVLFRCALLVCFLCEEEEEEEQEQEQE